MRGREKHPMGDFWWVAKESSDSELTSPKKFNLPSSWFIYIYTCKCLQMCFLVLLEPKPAFSLVEGFSFSGLTVSNQSQQEEKL